MLWASLTRRGSWGHMRRDQFLKSANLATVLGGKPLSGCAAGECKDTGRAAVELHRHRQPVPIEHLMWANTGDHVAAFYRKGIRRPQHPASVVIGENIEANRFVLLGRFAQGAGRTTEHFTLPSHEGNRPHIGVHCAPARLAGFRLRRGPHSPAGIAESQAHDQRNAESNELL